MPRRKKKPRRQSATSSGAHSGRDAKGRFTKGNTVGGRFQAGHEGFPAKRWRHAALTLAQAGIPPADVALLIREVFDQARAGDAKARQLFFDVMVGRQKIAPDMEAANPDESAEFSGETSSKREYYRVHFKAFCEDLFPHIVTTKTWSPMHGEWFSLRLEHHGARGVQVAFAAPRAHAKTSVLVLLASIHDIVNELERFILIVGSTATLATAKVKMIRDELESNQKLRELYGDLVGDTWNQGNFITKNGIRVQAVSPGSQVRGILHQGQRPTKLVLDDAENALHVQTQAQREKLATWFNSDMMKLGTVGELNVTVVGTILHPESLLSSLLTNPAFIGRRYQAVVAFNEQIALWAQWKDILSDLMNEQRQAVAEVFFQEHREAMLEGSQVLWESRLPYVELMKSRLFEGDVAFAFEYQNDPIAGGSLFDMANAGYFTITPQGLQRRDGRFIAFIDLVKLVAFYDPSTGTSDGDFGCCAILAEDSHGFKYILDCYIGRDPSSVQCARVAELLYRWQVATLGLETNGFQSLLSSNLREAFAEQALAQSARDWSTTLVEVVHTKAKVVRIASLEPSITRRWLWFADSLPAELMRQFRDFVAVADAGLDDGPDATEAAVKLLTPR